MDQRDLQLFTRLARSEPDFERWVRSELASLTDMLVSTPEDKMFRLAQGKAQFAQDILKKLAAARKNS